MYPAWGFSQPDALMNLLSTEMDREMAGLSKAQLPPYYMSYRVEDEFAHQIVASNGVLIQSSVQPQRKLTTQVRVGTPQLDNFHNMPQTAPPQGATFLLTMDDNPEMIRRVLWIATDREYNSAVSTYNQILANKSVIIEEGDKAPDYTLQTAHTYYDKPLKKEALQPDMKAWTTRAKKLSARFKPYSEIQDATMMFSYRVLRKYFVSSEGVRIAENAYYALIMVSASVKAEDGMVLPLSKTYFAHRPEDLPSDKVIEQDIDQIISKLQALRTAPVIDPYSGPALMSGDAAGVFFHEIFGHRIEGQRMKSLDNEQTFKKMVGHSVLPDNMSVVDDPTLTKYNTQQLYGSYKYDEEGVPGERVLAVEKGILKDFLMSRVPIDGFARSNGHGRAVIGKYPVTRQSNLIIETSDKFSRDDLRRMLIDEAKAQEKEYGLMFISVSGGFTNATTISPSAFNVLPTEVYKVYVDGRADELVRGIDIVGTPLSMFSSITHAGGEPRMFIGMCGAESGSLPVTAIAPDILVKKIEVQKKNKPANNQPLLPRPY